MTRMLRAGVSLFLAVLFVTSSITCLAVAPKTSAASFVLMEAESGRVIASGNELQERSIASTTKIMTCLVALEHSALEEPSYLPIAVKKDGTVAGNLASEGQFEKLARYVDRVLREIAGEVFSGNIDADPYARTPQQSACTYCEFASACHFEEGSGSDRMEYIKATKNDEFWQHIDEVNGEGARENG